MYDSFSRKPLAGALLINAFIFVLALLLCDFKYEISDDFIVEGTLAGAFTGHPSEFMLFSNVILGYILKAFYLFIPKVSWYFVFLEALGFASLCAVDALLIRKNKGAGIALSVIVSVILSGDLFILPSFTKTAAVAITAGGLLLLSRERTKGSIMAGFSLVILGALLRHHCIYLTAPLIGVMYLMELVIDTRKTTFKEAFSKHAKTLMLLATGFAVVFLLRGINLAIWNNTPGYSEYREYNALRSSVTDVTSYGRESVMDVYERLGLNDTDYAMISSWNFVDQDKYTPDTIRQIARAKDVVSAAKNHGIGKVLQNIISRDYLRYPVTVASLLLLSCLAFTGRKDFLFAIPPVITSVLLIALLFYRGRCLYRVEFAVLASLLLCLSVLVRDGGNDIRRGLSLLALTVFIINAGTYYPDKSYKRLRYEDYLTYANAILTESGDYDTDKYRLDISHEIPYRNLMAMVEGDDNHYMFDFRTTIQRTYYFYNPWIRVPEGEWENYTYLGSVTVMHPDNIAVWEDNGIDSRDPLKSIVNDNIYIVDNYNQDARLEYLRQNYYPDARMESAGTVDGLNIWKYYAE